MRGAQSTPLLLPMRALSFATPNASALLSLCACTSMSAASTASPLNSPRPPSHLQRAAPRPRVRRGGGGGAGVRLFCARPARVCARAVRQRRRRVRALLRAGGPWAHEESLARRAGAHALRGCYSCGDKPALLMPCEFCSGCFVRAASAFTDRRQRRAPPCGASRPATP